MEHPEVPVRVFTGTPERARGYIQDGFWLVAVGTDTLLLIQAVRDLAQKLR